MDLLGDDVLTLVQAGAQARGVLAADAERAGDVRVDALGLEHVADHGGGLRFEETRAFCHPDGGNLVGTRVFGGRRGMGGALCRRLLGRHGEAILPVNF